MLFCIGFGHLFHVSRAFLKQTDIDIGVNIGVSGLQNPCCFTFFCCAQVEAGAAINGRRDGCVDASMGTRGAVPPVPFLQQNGARLAAVNHAFGPMGNGFLL